MESRSPCGPTATGPVVRMQPDRASAVRIAVIGNRNARATRTGAIPQSETALVLHRLWLTNGFFECWHGREGRGSLSPRSRGEGKKKAGDQAVTPAPIGHDTPVPPKPQ